MDNEMLVTTIRELCQSKSIAISQLETDLEFGAGLISRWTKSSPSIDKIVDIANYFNVSLDEVVGYHNIINDKFLEKLIKQTSNNTVKWNKYSNADEIQPKRFSYPCDFDNFSDQYDYIKYCETHKEISYYVKVNSVYISIFGCYEYQNILHPSEIKLFIQPGDDTDLVEQDYDYDQLKALWLKVLYALGENAPDEIKAEEFKNSFINDFKKPEPPKKKKQIIFVNNPQNPQTRINQQPQRRNAIRPLTQPNQSDRRITQTNEKFEDGKKIDKDLTNEDTSQIEE